MDNKEILQGYILAYKSASDPECCKDGQPDKPTIRARIKKGLKKGWEKVKFGIDKTNTVMGRGIKATNTAIKEAVKGQ